MRAITLAVVILAASLVTADAAPAPGCSESSNQHELLVCADQSFRKADAALNADYARIMARLKGDPDTAGSLVQAQKAWLAFRDAECDFSTFATRDGTIHPMLVVKCREAMTRKRTETLKTYLACEEGDLSCPVPAQ